MAYIDPAIWRETTWADDHPVLIRRNKDPYGWMSNMSPFDVQHEGVNYRTTEHLFQCLRVEDEHVRSAIRVEKNPMKAKFAAKKHADKRTTRCLSEADLDNMRLCLRLKLDRHPALRDRLLDTDDRTIIEDCTKRQRGTGLFWGAALGDDGIWRGRNWLGTLWAEQRKRLREEALVSDTNVPYPDIMQMF